MTIPTTTMNMNGVQVQWISDKKERGVLATRSFVAGETLFEEDPQVSAQYLYNSLYFPACEYCLTCLESPKQQAARLAGLESEDQLDLPLANDLLPPITRLACPTCDAQYCSHACQTHAWNAYHQVLCPGVCTPHQVAMQQQIIDEWKSFHYPPETATITLVLKMVAMMCVAGSDEVFTAHFKADKANSALAIAAKFLDEQFADRIATFAGLFQERFAGLSKGAFECTPQVFEKAFTIVALNGQGIGTSAVEHFERALRKVADDKDSSSSAVEPDLAAHALEVMDTLRDLIAEHSEDFTHAEGTGLYRMHAMLNHACDANAQIEFAHGSHRLAVKATRDIEAGEEITLCYMDFGGCGDECGEGEEDDEMVVMDADGVVASSSAHHHHHHHEDEEENDDEDHEEEVDVETRRAQLREYYLFDCECNKCVAELAQQ
ncbi:hypothetical protein BCR44DRAFT_44709 [Catenaria anguillulae PL171]|uniref:Histone-lysine N-methyltransferase SET5 n=1 Tax=Catenaria anguillulae PL171 TaxID=765915 RepID=A0A1Y2HZI6_9FUNG|nr:hypothetical protein BCR44DRAFT_44709 [Catenaria anguillulae PL171]